MSDVIKNPGSSFHKLVFDAAAGGYRIVSTDLPPDEHVAKGPENDREAALAAVQRDWQGLAYVSEALKNDREIVMAAVQWDGRALAHASEALKNDYDIVLAAVRSNWKGLYYASMELRGNRDIVLEAMSINSSACGYAAPELRNDRAYALAIVKWDWEQLVYISDELKGDREIALAAVKQSARALMDLPASVRNDREIVLEAVKKNGFILDYASEELRNDLEIVLAAVRQHGTALRYASDKMKGNPEVVLAALEESHEVLAHASDTLKGDRNFILKAVQKYAEALEFASEELRGDKEIVRAAMRKDYIAFEYASEKIKDDREFVLEAVRKGRGAWGVLKRTSARLQDDREIVLAAVEQDWQALRAASPRLTDDRDVILAGIRQDGRAITRASPSLATDHELMLAAVQKDAYVIQWLKNGKNDEAIMLAAVEKNGMALRHASEELKGNHDIAIAAVQQNWRAIRYTTAALRSDNDATLSEFAMLEKQRQSSKDRQALNFLWLNLDLPPKPDFEDGSIRMPMPEEYIKNVRDAAKRHPKADIHLWVDSRRLTPKQYAYLEAVVEADMPNAHLKDLCTIPEYINEELYSRTETNKEWRSGYQGVIWLQVDAAKILISLQGDYDQKFFADLDHAHIDIESAQVQDMLQEHGLMIGSGSDTMQFVENQLWGFDRSREQFFRGYYTDGLKRSYDGVIAYDGFSDRLYREITMFDGINLEAICLPIGSIGLEHAVHPGHEWGKGLHDKGRSFVTDSELQKVFSERSARKTAISAVGTAASKPVVSGQKPDAS